MKYGPLNSKCIRLLGFLSDYSLSSANSKDDIIRNILFVLFCLSQTSSLPNEAQHQTEAKQQSGLCDLSGYVLAFSQRTLS